MDYSPCAHFGTRLNINDQIINENNYGLIYQPDGNLCSNTTPTKIFQTGPANPGAQADHVMIDPNGLVSLYEKTSDGSLNCYWKTYCGFQLDPGTQGYLCFADNNGIPMLSYVGGGYRYNVPLAKG